MTDLRDKIARALAEWQDGPNAEPWVHDMCTEAADAVLAVLDLDKIRAEAQVEVLRELAAGFVAPVLRLTESAPIPLHAVAGRLRDRADRIAREAGIATEGNKTGESND